MCLILEAELPGFSRKLAGDLTKEVSRLGLGTLRAVRVPKQEEGSRFVIASSEQECSCHFVGDSAEDTVVELDPRRTPELSKPIEYLMSKAGQQFNLWVADALGPRPAP